MNNEIHRCEYVSLLVEAEYVMWMAENALGSDCSLELRNAIRNYKATRQALVNRFSDTRLSA